MCALTKVNVLGAEYTITHTHDDPRMEDMDGFCDETTKKDRKSTRLNSSHAL